MLIDMICDHPGEPPIKTRYRDPSLLAAGGYQAIVIPQALSAIPAAYDSESVKSPHLRPSLASQPLPPPQPRDLEAQIDAQLQAAIAAGMTVFFHGHALMLPRTVVMRRPSDFLCDDPSGRLCLAKAAVFDALEDQIQELFDRWPAAAGLVMSSDHAQPANHHMLGTPLPAASCPACRDIPWQERLVRFIEKMHQVVIHDLGKIYVHRAWHAPAAREPSLHNDPVFYRAVSRRLPDSQDLVFSFRADQPESNLPGCLNPCLLADRRPKWIEFACERAFEGKGAFPNYQAGTWSDFLRRLESAAAAAGIDAPEMSRRFSYWGWSRGADGGAGAGMAGGGASGGPRIGREEWIDANVHALAQLVQNPEAPIQDIATAWAGTAFQIAESSPPAPAIAELLLISSPMLGSLLRPGTLERRVESDAWVRDDFLDIEAIWQAAGRIVDAGIGEAVLAEKTQALGVADRIRELFDLAMPDLPNKAQARELANTLICLGSFAGTVAHACRGFIQFVRWARAGRADPDLARSAEHDLRRAQRDWQQHTLHDALLPGAPSVFHENSFWDRTEDCLEQLSASAQAPANE